MTGMSGECQRKTCPALLPPLPSNGVILFLLRWNSRRGAGRHVAILHYDSSLNKTTVLTLRGSHQSFLGVQVQKHTHIEEHKHANAVAVRSE